MKPTIYIYDAKPIKGKTEKFQGISHVADKEKWTVTLEDNSTREFKKTEFKSVVAVTFIPYDPRSE